MFCHFEHFATLIIMFDIVCLDLFRLVYGPIEPFAELFLLVVLRNLIVTAFGREAAGHFIDLPD